MFPIPGAATLLVTLVLAGATPSAPAAEMPFEDVLRQAAADGKPVLIDFYTDW